ncbi:MAG: efflux RND transporter periplasmic adaptor subunit [Myxococcales bacterium]|nr:efflux RND transporter periplasmic adaptor subunit [Myxococcales bacterium]
MKALPGLLSLCLACGLLACGEEGPTAVVPVTRGDLVLEVDVTGTLKALSSAYLSPPSAPGMWNFNVVRMAAEGEEVKAGQTALVFDGSELERRLIERRAEMEVADKEIARKREEMALARREDEQKVAEAAAALRKAELKAELPEKFTAAVSMKLAELDVQAARVELAGAEARLRYATQLGDADMAFLRDRKARATSRLKEMEDAIASLAVKSPITGMAMYRIDWNGNKKKVGDLCWSSEACLEIADLSRLKASGEVDEINTAHLQVGQTVKLRLEAHPEREWRGKITEIGRSVYRQSPKTPLKVVHVDVALDTLDPIAMRPAMQLRGQVEIERKPDVLLVPVEAIFHRPEGPVVFRKTATGFSRTPVTLGKRNVRFAEALSGLSPGDELATRDLEVSE